MFRRFLNFIDILVFLYNAKTFEFLAKTTSNEEEAPNSMTKEDDRKGICVRVRVLWMLLVVCEIDAKWRRESI